MLRRGFTEYKANLGDEDEVRFGLAYTTTAIITDEAKASNAGGTDILVTTTSICSPFQALGAHRTAIVHALPIEYKIENNIPTDRPKTEAAETI